MKNKKIVILENNQNFAEKLKNAFEGAGYYVCGVSDDGAEGVRMIESFQPDLVIAEIFLKNLDGIAVLEAAKNFSSACIITVPTADNSLMQRVITKGAKYCLIKPFPVDIAVARAEDLLRINDNATFENLKDLSLVRKSSSLEEKISNIFISIGVPPHIKGYNYLREGIKMAVESPEIINNVTKVLYPKIGEKYATSASKVERAIRHAIEVAWNRGRIDVINAIFGARVYIGNEKPTNSEFIALVADKLILETMV